MRAAAPKEKKRKQRIYTMLQGYKHWIAPTVMKKKFQ
jgi:hypothetical protein